MRTRPLEVDIDPLQSESTGRRTKDGTLKEITVKNGWRGAAKRIGFLLTAVAAAFLAGIFLDTLVLGALAVDNDADWFGESSMRLLLVIPLLFLLFTATAATSVWLGRRSRISGPWLAWFLLSAAAIGPALLALVALTYHGGD